MSYIATFPQSLTSKFLLTSTQILPEMYPAEPAHAKISSSCMGNARRVLVLVMFASPLHVLLIGPRFIRDRGDQNTAWQRTDIIFLPWVKMQTTDAGPFQWALPIPFQEKVECREIIK